MLSHRYAKGREEDHQQDGGDNRVCCPTAPAGISGEAPGKDDANHQRRGKGHNVADRMERVVREDTIANQAQRNDAFQDWQPGRTNPSHENFPQANREATDEEAKDNEICNLYPPLWAIFKSAYGEHKTIVSRTGSSFDEEGDNKKHRPHNTASQQQS